ncbi:L,D-transpeptidase [Nannocystis sp. SCPEA4]|uniref:L,D-transpeptidase n=1 Tax=Nannocystis sp. SCPEA4 TaxID=2996787 RepID=UPI0022720B96|nr:L,D-transpeptidase [Nannocystis sp. SCPEA4]MCY1062363.1 L,D-transpeptidase [Nannocystis sp. SCPEA4]
MSAPRVRTSRPWLAALAGLALPIGPTAALVMFGPSCDDEADDEAIEAIAAVARPDVREAAHAAEDDEAEPADDDAPPAAAPGEPRPAAAAPEVVVTPPLPLGIRGAARTIITYASPRYGSEMRGRIDGGRTFAIYELVQGPDCPGEGWARVDHDDYACLKNAIADERAPALQPLIPEGLLVPFIYAKPRADRRGNLLAEVPRYKSKFALTSGAEPLEILAANHQYAFVEELQIPGHGKVMLDEDEQVVPLEGLKFEKPSEFFGRELAIAPVREGLTPAWAISREALLRRQPSLKAKLEGQLEYHQALDVKPELLRGGGGRWFEIPDYFGAGEPAYVESDKLRLWTPGLPLDDIPDGELWVDVDVGSQTLAIMRGQQPVFVTLVSSGTGHKPNTATPRGIYRIRNKLAYGPMRNRPEDAEDSPYHVEAVPWVQYFYRRFALHASYWHDGFGHRKSHGCVNLSPRDARYVFERTGPELPPGWMTTYAHGDRPGSVVRVRKGLEPSPDRRAEQEPAGDDDELIARADPPGA